MDEPTTPLTLAQNARKAAAEWQRAGIARRLEVLQRAGRALCAQHSTLLDLLRRESLSTRLAEYFGTWIVHAADPELLRSYARSLWRWAPAGSGGELLVRRADGVVLLVTPANSPTIQSASLFSILLPGNGVVVRAPYDDGGTRFLVEAILRPALVTAGFSPDLVSVVVGKSRPILTALLPSPDIDTIVFFGNSRAGESLSEQAARHRKKLVLELSGSDNLVVWKDASLADAVQSASRAWFGSAQPCPVPKHMLVHGSIFDRFVDAFLAEVPRHSQTVEADGEQGVLVGLADPAAYRIALEQIRAVGEIRCGGYTMAADGTPDPYGRHAAPTIVTLSAEAIRERPLLCFDEEISFPIIPIVRYDGDDTSIAEEMIATIERSPFGLRASVWTSTAEVLAHFVREIRSVGLVLCNDDHARTPVYASPWGGPKRSGGPRGESHFFWEQTSHLQAITCERLSEREIRALALALGCGPELEGLLT
jgi:acyl-CoA reductase-like NAD-dependent aldehyde dehydrogenase